MIYWWLVEFVFEWIEQMFGLFVCWIVFEKGWMGCVSLLGGDFKLGEFGMQVVFLKCDYFFFFDELVMWFIC